MKANQKGFSVVEILTAILVVGLLGVVGWQVYDHLNNKMADDRSQQSSQSQTPVSSEKTSITVDAYANWQTYNLKYEKFSFKYPKSYTLEDKSAANSDVTPGSDVLRLTKDNGFVISMQTGAYGIGGACDTCVLALSKEISFLGKTAYLNFVDKGSGNIGYVNVAADTVGWAGGLIRGKNVKSNDNNATLPIVITMLYTQAEKPLQTISDSDEIAEAIKILESASY